MQLRDNVLLSRQGIKVIHFSSVFLKKRNDEVLVLLLFSSPELKANR